jgi:hypothetical protein
MKLFYLLCAIAGTLIPYSQFVPWVAEHGLDVRLLAGELFSTRIGAFFGLDVMVAAVALRAFIGWEGRRRHMRLLWLPVAATLAIGVSCGLPLFLFLREQQSPTLQPVEGK